MEQFFHYSFISLFVAMMTIRAFYHYRAVKYGGRVQYKEKRIFRVLIAFSLAYFVSRYLTEPEYLDFANLPLSTMLQWIGLALGVATIPLTIWIHTHLNLNFSSILHLRDKHTLITTGPYRLARHPMYTVLFIHFLGILLMSRNWIVGGLPIAILIIIVSLRLRKEERLMLEKFGDEYRRYVEKTKKFLPKIF